MKYEHLITETVNYLLQENPLAVAAGSAAMDIAGDAITNLFGSKEDEIPPGSENKSAPTEDNS